MLLSYFCITAWLFIWVNSLMFGTTTFVKLAFSELRDARRISLSRRKIVDLRLLGLASRKWAVSEVCREALPWTWGAFLVSALSGAMLFLAQPVKYFNNYAFQVKFLLMVFAGINMLVFEFITYRGVAAWDRDAAVPLAANLAGAISLVAWIAIIAYGRWTAYYML